jgi:hypothetical protein
VSVTIDTNGYVSKIDMRTIYEIFREKIDKAINNVKWTPAKFKGRSVSSEIKINMEFILESPSMENNHRFVIVGERIVEKCKSISGPYISPK